MSEQKTNKPVAAREGPLVEVKRRLEQIAGKHPDTRLTVDMARDAVQEAERQLAFLAARARRSRRKRLRQRDHIRELFDALARVPVPPWSVPEPSSLQEETVASYRQLREQGLPNLARELHAAANRGDTRDYLLLLSDQVLRRGQRMLIEGLVHHPGTARVALAERIRPLLGGQLCKVLARQAGYRMAAEPGKSTDALLRQALALLDALMHTSPSLRLFWAEPGEAFDPSRHERSAGKPASDGRAIRATLLPGLWLPGEGRVLERALVATRRPEGAEGPTAR